MKLTIIWSSPNEDGLTAQAAQSFARGASRGGAQVTLVPLNQLTLEHCRACDRGWGRCKSQGSCIIDDDFAPLYSQLAASDAFVLVSAVYWHDLTEQMKTFLDRLRRCETGHNGYLKGRECFVAACAGGTGHGATECLRQTEKTLGHLSVHALDLLPVTRFNKGYLLPALEEAGETFMQQSRQAP